MELRIVVGVLGMALPFVLALGALIIFDTGLQESVSAYYHTGMGDVFVGTLFVIGFFMYSYRGPERRDDKLGDFACLAAVGVALFPTAEVGASGSDIVIGYIHTGFTLAFFGTLIWFSLMQFTKTHDKEDRTEEKKQRDKVYIGSGLVMTACILLIGVNFLLRGDGGSGSEPSTIVFWLEAITVFAFGVSWLTKGEAILGDPKKDQDQDSDQNDQNDQEHDQENGQEHDQENGQEHDQD